MPKSNSIQAQKFIGFKMPMTKNKFDEKDSILYALGVGFSRDPLRQEDFRYTNEFDDNFITFPTIGVTAPQSNLIEPMLQSQNFPEFSPFVILHAEQKLILIKDKLEPGVDYFHETEVVDCMDKGKNAFVMFKTSSYVEGQNGKKQLAYQNQSTLFLRGLGGFNYAGKGLIKSMPQIPKRNPDYKLTGQTFPGQAFLYRLCFDRNPLHIVPSIAKSQKFDRPIIHGLASYGTVARVFVQQVLGNDSTKLKSVHTRFVGHVYPGETLEVAVWKTGNDTFLFEASVKQRGTKACVGVIESRPSAKL